MSPASGLPMLCRNVTTFAADKSLDEGAFRQSLQRLVDAGIGVYLASTASGEGHSLSRGELRRVYEIGVEVCKGKVPVASNQPEEHTAAGAIAQAKIAIDAGVDFVNIYGPAGFHGYRPTDAEFIEFYTDVAKEIDYPIALAPNNSIGYMPSAALIADVANQVAQVQRINILEAGDTYFLNLKQRLNRDIPILVSVPGCLELLSLGAGGLLGAQANIIPQTFRRFIDGYEQDDVAQRDLAYTEILKFIQYIQRWPGGSPRAFKTMMSVFKLPGGEGGVRKPYLMPPPAEVERFTDGLLRLRLTEIDELARAADVPIPD
ncbi:MAG: dihydrodipicolinate synthase family protein [Dehalococcoidia bacterium]|nr:dihydrodipicolinate synthase family protein [Dehalococcoidia bacterium]